MKLISICKLQTDPIIGIYSVFDGETLWHGFSVDSLKLTAPNARLIAYIDEWNDFGHWPHSSIGEPFGLLPNQSGSHRAVWQIRANSV